jgi:hypothetical protein
MKRFLSVLLAAAVLPVLCAPAPADEGDKDAQAILDKAIKALGGQEKLDKARAFTSKFKGKLNLLGMELEVTGQSTSKGLDHYRSELTGELGGNALKLVTVISGKKGWRNVLGMTQEFDKTALANEKRALYLQVVPVTLVPLKGKGFKVKSAGEEKVDGKPAVVLQVTGPDGKDFKLAFDKESGLPVRLTAKVRDQKNQEIALESNFTAYKEFDGIKRATKVQTKIGGKPLITQEITDFKVLDKVDDKTFAEPE